MTYGEKETKAAFLLLDKVNGHTPFTVSIYKRWKFYGTLPNWYKQTLMRVAFSAKNLRALEHKKYVK